MADDKNIGYWIYKAVKYVVCALLALFLIRISVAVVILIIAYFSIV